MGTSPFRYGHAVSAVWDTAADACLEALGSGHDPVSSLGFLYAREELAPEMAAILGRFRERTGVEHWVGTVGGGICATGTEYYEGAALAAMVGSFAPGSFRVFAGVGDDLSVFNAAHGEWAARHHPRLALVHADPRTPDVPRLVEALAERLEDGFLVGGIASGEGDVVHLADGVWRGGLSGVMFSEQVSLSTRLSQGCSPIGPRREISESERNVLVKLDGRPALDALREDIGEVLSRDLSRIGGYIFAGLPIEGSDTGDYLVRNLVGIDTQEGLVAIGDWARAGAQVLFCRRDAQTARNDLGRMLEGLVRTLTGPPRGAVYVSCLGRGANLFGGDSAELRLVRDVLGEVPLVGFYANGEISHRRVYGYTAVLTLFL